MASLSTINSAAQTKNWRAFLSLPSCSWPATTTKEWDRQTKNGQPILLSFKLISYLSPLPLPSFRCSLLDYFSLLFFLLIIIVIILDYYCLYLLFLISLPYVPCHYQGDINTIMLFPGAELLSSFRSSIRLNCLCKHRHWQGQAGNTNSWHGMLLKQYAVTLWLV